MELRKIQLTGGSSHSVTLPKEWTARAKLKAGDLVGFLEQPGGGLSLFAHAREERAPRRHVIEFSEIDDEFLFRQIVAAYLMGYDAIVVKSKAPLTPQSRNKVRDAVKRIMGLEIVEEDTTTVTMQDFLDPREFHMERALRRMLVLARSMQEDAISAIRKPSAEALASTRDRDNEVDKLYWLINKQYHALLGDITYAGKMGLTPSEALNFLLVARLVERIADHAVRISQQAALLPESKALPPLLEKVERMGRKATDLFQGAVQDFLQRDAKKANLHIDEAVKLQESLERLVKEAASQSGETVAHLAFIIESLVRTSAYAADIGEVAIDHQLAKPIPSP